MEIENRNGEANLSWTIRNIEGDMGEKTRLDLLLQADGDVIVAMRDTEEGTRMSIEFCSSGGRNPMITRTLRTLVYMLAKASQ